MLRLFLIIIVFMFNLLSSVNPDEKIKYKTFKKLPCSFNGTKIDSPAAFFLDFNIF